MSVKSWTANVVRRVLPNGLTVLIERNSTAPVVAAVTHVKAGYFDEPDHWVGIAHVLEHMFFKGTSRRGPGELAKETQLLGGYLNAGTIYDKTVYYTVLPSGPGALDKVVDLQADALMHSALDRDELSRELEVIIQEAKRKLDEPGAVAQETLFEVLFAEHRIRRWRIGTEDGLRRLNAYDVRTYYETRYTPGRTIVALVGDLDVEEALELAERVYGGWPTSDAEVEAPPPERNSPGPGLRVLHGDVKRPIAVLGWRSVDAHHPDVHALDVASSVLGSGRGSWLHRAVRTPGFASSVGGTHYTPTQVGVFNVSLESDPDTVDQAVSRSLELVGRLSDRGPSQADLDRVRSLTAMRWSRRLESMDGRAAVWCEFEALGGLHLVDEYYERGLTVTADEVRIASSKYLDPQGGSAVMYLPTGVESRLSEGAWPPATNGDHVTAVEVPPLRSWSGKPLGGGYRDYPGELRHYELPGVDLLIRPKRDCGLVYVGLHVLGLRELETDENAGISALTARAAIRGAAGMNAEQLALAAERLGGTVSPSVSLGSVGWGLTVRADAVRDAARLLYGVATEPSLEDQSIEVERVLQVSDAKRARDDMFGYPVRRVLETALPGSGYGLPTIGTPESVSALSAKAVREWADSLRQRRLTAIAVGDLATDAMLEALAPIGEWPVPRLDPVEMLPPGWRPSAVREHREKAQTALAMGFPGVAYGSPDRFAVVVVGSLLSGLAGRLFESLREKRSLAYTVVALPWLKRHAGAMLSYIATSPEREGEARDAMLEELTRLPDDEIPAAELDRARQYAAGTVQLRLQSAHAVAGEILDAWTHGDLSVVHTVPQRLRSVTEEDVRRVASEVFDPDQRAEFVVEGTGGGK